MKQLNLFDGTKLALTDKEAKAIMNNIEDVKFFKTKSGYFVNVSSISSITEIQTEQWWYGYKLEKSGTYFMRDGYRCYLEPHNYGELTEVSPLFDDLYLKLEQQENQEQQKLQEQQNNEEGLLKLKALKNEHRLDKKE